MTTFSVQTATSGVAKQILLHGLQIALSIATYIILSDMSGFGARVQRTNLKIMSLLTTNTPGGISTYLKRSTMPTTRQRIPNTCGAMFPEDGTCFGIFPVL